MKLPKFLQTSYRKIVEWLFLPVFAFQIVKPFDKVENSFVISPAAFDRGHNFFDIVFFRLFDVVRFPEYFSGVRWCPVFAGLVWLE